MYDTATLIIFFYLLNFQTFKLITQILINKYIVFIFAKFYLLHIYQEYSIYSYNSYKYLIKVQILNLE